MRNPSPITCRAQRDARASALALTLLATLAGCASQIPQAIRTAPATAVTVAQVQQDQARYQGQAVRWGGTIIAVNNLPTATEVEVLARPLGLDGEPRTWDEGQGRFIAQVAGFLDPAQYEKERALTVVGTLTGVQTRPVGDYRYAYPVVRVETQYLWPKGPPPGAYGPYSGYPGYGYPGWYDPWGPWFGPGYGPWIGPAYGPRVGPGRRGYAPYRGHVHGLGPGPRRR